MNILVLLSEADLRNSLVIILFQTLISSVIAFCSYLLSGDLLDMSLYRQIFLKKKCEPTNLILAFTCDIFFRAKENKSEECKSRLQAVKTMLFLTDFFNFDPYFLDPLHC